MFININNKTVKGSTNEQTFKRAYLTFYTEPECYYFCIETEETVQGFPDVLCIHKKTGVTKLMEFKYTKTGKIKFQPTQPAFYKQCSELKIDIVAYDAKESRLHFFPASFLFEPSSPYHMSENNTVDLSRAYKELI